MRVTGHGPGEGDATEPGLYDSCSYSVPSQMPTVTEP